MLEGKEPNDDSKEHTHKRVFAVCDVCLGDICLGVEEEEQSKDDGRVYLCEEEVAHIGRRLALPDASCAHNMEEVSQLEKEET